MSKYGRISSISISFIPHSSQRYDTCGDWILRNEKIILRISKEMGFVSGLAVAVHELVEVVLCMFAGITQHQVDGWDLAHLEDPGEPGEIKGCPYFKQHAAATIVERAVCLAFLMSWRTHNRNIEKCK